MRNAQVILLGVILLVIASCTISGPAYSGPRLPREQVALVSSDDTLEIAKIDDHNYFRRPVRDVEVLPGEHTFMVVYMGAYNARRVHSRETPVRLRAAAGRSYHISANLQPATHSELITNLGVGRITFQVRDVTAERKSIDK